MKTILTKKTILIGSVVLVALLGLLKVYIFSGDVILPQFFSIFGLKIYYYGLCMALGVLVAYYFAKSRLESYGIKQSDLDNLVLILIINGFIGARLYHVFSSFGYYQNNWTEVFSVWNGGLSIFGAIIGGLLGVYAYQRFYMYETRVSLLKLLDFLAPSVIIGQIIGRFGNLFNYEAYGTPTNLAWKMFVPQIFRTPPYEVFEYFHPLFLYEALAGLLILILLIKLVDIVRTGQIFFIWLGLYSVVRFGTELLRLDSPYLFGVKQNLISSGLLIVVSVVVIIYLSKKSVNESNQT